MASDIQKKPHVTLETVVRKRNQVTLPGEAIEALGLSEGDTILLEITGDSATMRPVRRSYAGIALNVYDNGYLGRERDEWQ